MPTKRIKFQFKIIKEKKNRISLSDDLFLHKKKKEPTKQNSSKVSEWKRKNNVWFYTNTTTT